MGTSLVSIRSMKESFSFPLRVSSRYLSLKRQDSSRVYDKFDISIARVVIKHAAVANLMGSDSFRQLQAHCEPFVDFEVLVSSQELNTLQPWHPSPPSKSHGLCSLLQRSGISPFTLAVSCCTNLVLRLSTAPSSLSQRTSTTTMPGSPTPLLRRSNELV